uniref:Uncharacterized protein n=1 Tax=Octactis speculum TaxID=3111310 RepID=A0A7S2BPG5_9STRA|mmetsp:Transcript_25600/g.35178  ORF Transcript_25600/g.35178 Transcript_25600/m.35178 type:complete len:101 (+) Transcript_25600:367-669(+)
MVAVTAFRRSPREAQETGAVCIIIWCIICPWVIFQILLCVFEYEQSSQEFEGGGLKARGVFAPLVLWFSVLTLIFCVYAVTRQSLQHSRPELETLLVYSV